LIDYFTEILYGAEDSKTPNQPWKDIDFFSGGTYNRLSESAINQLKEKVEELGIQKTEVGEYVQQARIKYFRAYESWTDEEDVLLAKALEYTNDISVLCECFQRGIGSIESRGKRIIYEKSIRE
jgi:hypothetical protein